MENHNTSSAKKSGHGKRNKKKGKAARPPTQTQNRDSCSKENAEGTDIANDTENCPIKVDSTEVEQLPQNCSPLLKGSGVECDEAKKEGKNGDENSSRNVSQNSLESLKSKENDSSDVLEVKHKSKINENTDKLQQKDSALLDNEVIPKNVTEENSKSSEKDSLVAVKSSNRLCEENNVESVEETKSEGEFDEQKEENRSIASLGASQAAMSKSKQDLLLAALEKPCVLNKCIANGNDPQSPEKCVLDAKTHEKNTNPEAQLDKKKEKELRKLEWQKKMMEQNAKKDKNEEGLSKAELRAKRREQQEAQRLAKLAAKEQKPQQSSEASSKNAPDNSAPKSSSLKEQSKQSKSNLKVAAEHGKPSKLSSKTSTKVLIKASIKKSALAHLLGHLYCASSKTVSNDDKLVNLHTVHPDFMRLGVRMSSKVILGSNARCLAMLYTIMCLVRDLQTPPKQEFCRYLEHVLQSSVEHLNSCRPLAVCMKNALKYFKSQSAQLDINHSENEKRNELIEVLETYIREEIEKADECIVMETSAKIKDGDVILTFGCSSLVEKVLLRAKDRNMKFSVLVMDSRPLLEGREMLRRLIIGGVQCRYIQMSLLHRVIKSVSLVFLGAHGLLSNGYIMSRAGAVEIAMVAKIFNKPVIICSEAYKLSDLVQSDAFVYNELGDENEMVGVHPIHQLSSSLKKNNKVSLVSLLYDFTPPNFISAVITELGSFHAKSVNSIRRMKPTKLL